MVHPAFSVNPDPARVPPLSTLKPATIEPFTARVPLPTVVVPVFVVEHYFDGRAYWARVDAKIAG